MNRRFINKTNGFNQLDRNNYNTLKSKGAEYSGIVIKFENHDGTIRTVNSNEKFFERENGETLRISEIIQKINAMQFDLYAKSYKII